VRHDESTAGTRVRHASVRPHHAAPAGRLRRSVPKGVRTRGEGVRANRACESTWVPRGVPRDSDVDTRLRERMRGHVPCGQRRLCSRPRELCRDVSSAYTARLLRGGFSRYLRPGAGGVRAGGDCPGEAVRSGMQGRRGSRGMPPRMRGGRGDGNDPVRRRLRHLHRPVPAPDDDHHDLARPALHERRTVQRRQWVHGGPLREGHVRARVRVRRRDGRRELLPGARRSVRSPVRHGCERNLRWCVFRVERGLYIERGQLCVHDVYPVLCERVHADVGLLRALHGPPAGSVRGVSPGAVCRDAVTRPHESPGSYMQLQPPRTEPRPSRVAGLTRPRSLACQSWEQPTVSSSRSRSRSGGTRADHC
jgi:hypothetical protein